MPLVFDGINRSEKKMSDSSSTATNNNQSKSKSLATANHRDIVKQPSTDIVATTTTTTKQSKSTRQYKSKNDKEDNNMKNKDSKSKSTPASSSTNTTNCKTATSSSTASMASSNRRQSIHRSVKSTKPPPISASNKSTATASTSITSTNDTSSTLQTATTPSNQQYQENDTFLSLSNPTYKSVLYTHFQQMNNNDTREEEKRVATKIINIFKKNGGRFYKKSGRGNVPKEMNFVQVDEDAALRKIQDDIRRRRENAQHWQHQSITAPPEEADIPSPLPITTRTKTDKKKKSSKKGISVVRREAAKLGWESRMEQSKDDEEDMAADEDGSSMSNSSTGEEARTSKTENDTSDLSIDREDDTTAELSSEDKKNTTATVVKKEIKKRESKARTVKLTHPHASSDIKAQSSPTSTSSASAVVKKEKKKSKTPVKKTKKSTKPRAGSSRQQRQTTTTTIRPAQPSEKRQADAQQVTKSNGMTEWQCPKCSKKFAWKSPQCAGACISNHMRKSHGITLPTMKELSQKKKEKKKSSSRRVVGGTSRSSRSSRVRTFGSSSSLSGATQQPKQEKTRPKRGRESSVKKASVTFDSDIQSYLGEEPIKKKRRSDSTSSRSCRQKKNSVESNTPSKVVSSKSKRAAPSRRRSSAKTTNHVTPTSMQKTKSPEESTSLVVIESSSNSKKSGTNKLNFAQKLHAMIMDADENHPDTLCWNEEGGSFIVKERDTPLQPLLSRYFRTTKYTSLYRSLANYGFVADYVKIQEKDVVCFMREDFTRDSTPIELSCFTKDKSTTAEKIVSIKEEESTASRRSVPKRKAFTNACGVIQGAMTEQDDDISPIKEEEEEDGVVFEVGQRIEARYRGQGRRWYKGTVVAALGNGLYDIDYDDGDSDRSLSSDAIRVRMPRRKKMSKKQQQKKSASLEQPYIGEEDDIMMIDTFNSNTQQQSAPLLNERQRIIFDLVSGREDENDDSVDKENTSKAGVGLFSPIKTKRVTFASTPSTNMERVAVQENSEVVNDSSFSPIKSFNQVQSKDIYSRHPTSLDTSSLAKSTTQTLPSPTQVIISSKSQAGKKEQMQPLTLVKVGVIDNEVVMPPSKEDDDTSFEEEDTTDTFQGLLSLESDSNTPSSKDPGDDLFQFNWDGRASSSDDFLADEIGYDLFSTNRMASSRRGTYASGRGTMYPSYPSGHGKARTSSSWDKIRL